MHESHFFEYKDSKLHYTKSGQGDRVLFTFHGFGQNYKAFDPIIAKLTKDYTVYSFDLYYHGKSHWLSSADTLSKNIWKEIVEEFCRTHSISTFSMLCFSMGGKFTLAATEMLPHKVDKLILMAPDGIQTSLWYNLATYPVVFQRYFEGMIVKPHRFFRLLSFFKKIGFVDKGISKFAASQMNTVKNRRRVYYSWVVFKNLVFDMRVLSQIINENKIDVIMILGKHDKIITEKGMNKLLNKLNDYQLKLIESGHNDLIKKTSEDGELMAEF